MKVKKILTSIVVLMLLFVTHSFAADTDNAVVFDISQSAQNNVRKFAVKVNSLDENAVTETIYVIRDGEIDPVADDKIEYTELANAVYAGESSNSMFEFNLQTGDSKKGIYTIIAGGYGSSNDLKYRYQKFWYDGEVNVHTDYINDLSSGVTVQKLLAGNKQEYYINTDNAAFKANPTLIAQIIDGLKGNGFTNQFEVEKAYKVACDFVDSQNMSAVALKAYIKYYNDKLGLDTTNEDYAEYPDNTIAIFKKVLDGCSGNSEVANVSDIRKAFRNACAVSCIDKTIDYRKSIENLKKYNDVFELDYTSKLPYIDSLEVAKIFAMNSYSSVDEIKNDYNNRVDTLYSNYLSNNSGKGNQGGSSGGGGGGYSAGMTLDSKKINEIIGKELNFADVPNGHWASDYIDFVYDNRIMSGDGNKLFRPDDNISREEWVKTILSAFAIETESVQSTFADVPNTRWSYPYISKAFELTIVNGVNSNSFEPAASISRQDAVVMLFRLVNMVHEDFDYGKVAIEFTDEDDISDYASDAVDKMTSIDVIKGYQDGTFQPQKTLSRAEAAKIIKVLLDTVG